jgi:hypothetical protein
MFAQELTHLLFIVAVRRIKRREKLLPHFLLIPCEVRVIYKGRTPLESSRNQVVTQKRVGEVLLDLRRLENYLLTVYIK